MFSGAEKLTKTIWYPLHGYVPSALEHQMQFGNRVPKAIPREGQSQPCCNRCAARAQAGALLAKLLQTLIYNLFCFSWQKRWVMSGLI